MNAPSNDAKAEPATGSSLPAGRPCGPLDCRAFDKAEQLLAYLVDKTEPLVLAVGEFHAQKGHALKASPTVRFSGLLPFFGGKAKDLVLELWARPNDCGDDRVAEVAKAQQEVTVAQASTNKNEFFELGTRAKTLGIFPHALIPTCQDYADILAATNQDIAKMLELTASRTSESVVAALGTRTGATTRPLVITYGGALHNDISPREGRQSWSFGPQLQSLTQGRYVELDLVLREQVRDTESFRALPWYPYLNEPSLRAKFVLYEMGLSSYALVFPAEEYLPEP